MLLNMLPEALAVLGLAAAFLEAFLNVATAAAAAPLGGGNTLLRAAWPPDEQKTDSFNGAATSGGRVPAAVVSQRFASDSFKVLEKEWPTLCNRTTLRRYNDLLARCQEAQPPSPTIDSNPL